MGYYSDVSIATTEEGYERIARCCDALGLEHPLLSSDAKPDFVNRHEGCVLFGWQGVKWYEGAAEVDAVMSALASLKGDGVPVMLVRTGEDWGDIEAFGSSD